MTTGSKAKFWEEFEKYILNLKNIFSCPIWVWFWVKTKENVEKVCKVADFAIIWSEFIKKYNNEKTDWIKKYINFITTIN
jgi:tryptophan synthase alpha subunit